MPLAHAGHNAVFNTARRMRQQFLYVVPPFVGAYWLSQWMDKRYVREPAADGEKFKPHLATGEA